MTDRQTLLIVEDDQNLARMLAEFFDAQGFTVRLAEWGLDAVYACWEQPPTLALLDIHLPDISGYEIARRLHAHRRTRDIPLIFLTGRRRREDRLQGLELGAVDYIAKPFDLQELHLRVRNALRRRQNPWHLLFNPITQMPEGALVDEHLDVLLERQQWAAVVVGLRNLEPFREAYGFVAADDVLKAISLKLRAALDTLGSPVEMLGQIGPAEFLVVTRASQASEAREAIQAHLGGSLGYFYPLEDCPEPLDPARHLALHIQVCAAPAGPLADAAALKDSLLAAARP